MNASLTEAAAYTEKVRNNERDVREITTELLNLLAPAIKADPKAQRLVAQLQQVMCDNARSTGQLENELTELREGLVRLLG